MTESTPHDRALSPPQGEETLLRSDANTPAAPAPGGPSPAPPPDGDVTLAPSSPALPPPGGEATLAPSSPPAPRPGSDATQAPSSPENRDTLLREPGQQDGKPLVPGYEILERVGWGGMGVVYKALHLRLHRLVALKMILGGAHVEPAVLARFLTEAEAVARLPHPNIVQIYEVGERDGLPYLSLEFCPGGSLDRKLNGTPLPAGEAAQLVETLAHAMQAAHAHGVVHRDLKPANVLLAEDGTLKITDFGLAKKLDAPTGQTQSGAILGTPSYMAPEQARGKGKEVGPAADIYALGAILYELLTGRPPFKAATPLDTMLQVMSEEPVPPSRLQPRLPRDLEKICLKCLEKEPTKRYASAGDLADDLHRYRNGETVRARSVTIVGRAVKAARRRPAVAALVVVSAIALVSLVAGGVLLQAQRARELQLKAQAALEAFNRGDEVRQLVTRGQKAFAAKDWPNAKLCAAQALAKIGNAPQLDSLRDQAEELQREAEEQLAQVRARQQAQEARQQAQEVLDRFRQQREEARFHATLATGAGKEANLTATRKAARQALQLYQVTVDGKGRPVLGPSLNVRERDETVADCYELLLLLAEAEAQPLPGEKLAGQAREALRALDRAATLGFPDHPTQAYHLRRARYLEQVGDKEQAQEERKQARARPPSTALDYYLVGDEHYKQGDLQAAVRDFEAALRKQPDNFWAHYFLSVCYLRLGGPAEAKLGLTDCLPLKPDFVWVYLLRGFAQVQLKEFPAAAEDFRKAQELLKRSPDPDAEHVLYANRGVLWFQQDRYPEAVADLERAIARKPDEYQAYVTLAQVYQKQKKWDDAVAQVGKAIALEPGLAFLYYLRARLREERPAPDLEAALHDLDRAVAEEGPAGDSLTLARYRAERGRVLDRSGHPAEAVKAYQEALKGRPDFTRAYLWLAEAQIKLRAYQEAADALDQYLARGGRPQAEVYRARGAARARLGNSEAAAQDYTQALGLKPDDPDIRAARGWAYLSCAAYRLARADFDHVLDQDPHRAEAYVGRGLARARLGQEREAAEDAETALRQAPPSAPLLRDAAQVYAQLVGRLDTQPAADPRLAAAQRSAYQDRALDLLHEAAGLTPPAERAAWWRAKVRGDAALAPLRDSARYRQMDLEFSRLGAEGRALP